LPPAYARTYALVRGGWRTASEIAKQDGCSSTAAINRLEKLREWRLVTRRRVEPRGYEYSLAGKGGG